MDNGSPVVSVIMPVYNAVKYVSAAIESVLEQTFTDFELILVDDGAFDGSGQICDKYAEADSRVIVIHKENDGICNARNIGMQYAKGKYLAFCDHDDIYLKNYLETAVNAAIKNKSKLLKFEHTTEVWNDSKKIKEFTQKLPNNNLYISQLVNCYDLFNCAIRALWNGIYLRSVIIENNIKFNEDVKFGMEDYLFNLEVLEYIDEVSFVSNLLYVHYDRIEQSTSAKYAPQKYKDIINTAKKEKAFFKKHHASVEKIEIHHQQQYLLFYLAALTHPNNLMTIKQKKDKLKELNTPQGLALQCSRKVCFKILFKFPKNAVIAILYNFKAYGILLLLYGKYRMMTRYKNDVNHIKYF